MFFLFSLVTILSLGYYTVSVGKAHDILQHKTLIENMILEPGLHNLVRFLWMEF